MIGIREEHQLRFGMLQVNNMPLLEEEEYEV